MKNKQLGQRRWKRGKSWVAMGPNEKGVFTVAFNLIEISEGEREFNKEAEALSCYQSKITMATQLEAKLSPPGQMALI
ncbi:MAG: hypothetical protein RPR91_04195 [Colwellia sp.]|jgi:hypothetical protein